MHLLVKKNFSDKSSSCPQSYFVKFCFIIIISLISVLPSFLFSSIIRSQNLYSFTFSPMRAKLLANLILFHFIALKILSESINEDSHYVIFCTLHYLTCTTKLRYSFKLVNNICICLNFPFGLYLLAIQSIVASTVIIREFICEHNWLS